MNGCHIVSHLWILVDLWMLIRYVLILMSFWLILLQIRRLLLTLSRGGWAAAFSGCNFSCSSDENSQYPPTWRENRVRRTIRADGCAPSRGREGGSEFDWKWLIKKTARKHQSWTTEGWKKVACLDESRLVLLWHPPEQFRRPVLSFHGKDPSIPDGCGLVWGAATSSRRWLGLCDQIERLKLVFYYT